MQPFVQRPGWLRHHRLKSVAAVGLGALAVVLAAAWFLSYATNGSHPTCGTNEEHAELSTPIVNCPDGEPKDGYNTMPAIPLPALEQEGDGQTPLSSIIDFDPPNPPAEQDMPPPGRATRVASDEG